MGAEKLPQMPNLKNAPTKLILINKFSGASLFDRHRRLINDYSCKICYC